MAAQFTIGLIFSGGISFYMLEKIADRRCISSSIGRGPNVEDISRIIYAAVSCFFLFLLLIFLLLRLRLTLLAYIALFSQKMNEKMKNSQTKDLSDELISKHSRDFASSISRGITKVSSSLQETIENIFAPKR